MHQHKLSEFKIYKLKYKGKDKENEKRKQGSIWLQKHLGEWVIGEQKHWWFLKMELKVRLLGFFSLSVSSLQNPPQKSNYHSLVLHSIFRSFILTLKLLHLFFFWEWLRRVQFHISPLLKFHHLFCSICIVLSSHNLYYYFVHFISRQVSEFQETRAISLSCNVREKKKCARLWNQVIWVLQIKLCGSKPNHQSTALPKL